MTNHELWEKRERELLKEAKRIYRESKDFDPEIDLDSEGDGVYDLMNEEDWQKFRKIEKKIKDKYKKYS